MKKVKQSTAKPIKDEMRLINGKVMIWDGKKWITEREDYKQFILKSINP